MCPEQRCPPDRGGRCLRRPRTGTAPAPQRLPAAAGARHRPGSPPAPAPPLSRAGGSAARSSSRPRDSSLRVFWPPLHTRRRSGTA